MLSHRSNPKIVSTLEADESSHPPCDELAQFNLGRLSESRSDEIDKHLEVCHACCRTLGEFRSQPDPFLLKLVSATENPSIDSAENALGQVLAASWDNCPSPGDPNGAHINLMPQTIGRFLIQEEIGCGGFGIVWRAYDPNLRREIAVKIPRYGVCMTREVRERFVREAQAAAALDHPHIVPIYEAVCDDTICYIATAYCCGPNLSAFLKQLPEPLPIETIARWACELAEAVEHAHSRGVLHRDLKPSNVMLDTLARVPKITDFGLAKIEGASPGSTRSNVVLGTPAYMSPEQASGRSNEVGPQSDVYSLGAILYELLTGRPPLVGESDVDTIARVRQEEPIPPSRLRPGLPRDLETICLSCLQKEPQHRYSSATAFAEDLRRFSRGEPILARPVSQWEHFWRWCHRKPALASMSLAIVTLLSAIVTGSVVFAFRLNAAGQRTLAQLNQTRAAERAAVNHRVTAEKQLFASLVAQGRSRRLSGHAGQRFEGLRALREAADLSRRIELSADEKRGLRNEVIACLALTDLRLDKTWKGYPPGSSDTGIAFDSGLDRYAMIDADGFLVIRRMEDNHELARIDLDAPLARGSDWRLFLAFSPNGKHIVARGMFMGSYAIPTRIWDWATGELILSVPRDHHEFGLQCDFSSDGRRFAIALAGSVAVHDLETKVARMSSRGPTAKSVCFDPTGKILAVCRGTDIDLVEWEIDRQLRRIRSPSQVRMADWSPDGELIAMACIDGHVRVFSAATGEIATTLSRHQGDVIHVAFNERGDQIVSTGYDGTSRVWDVASGASLIVERGVAGPLSLDGRWLAYGTTGSTLGRWEVARSRVLRKISFQPDRIAYSTIDPKGRFLVAVGPTRVAFFDTDNDEELLRVPLELPNLVTSLAVDKTTDALLTSSRAGIHRWPIDRSLADRVRIGPPSKVDSPHEAVIVKSDVTADRRIILKGDSRATILDSAASTQFRVRHPGLYDVASSSDGRWLATSAWQGYQARIWDVRSNKLVKEISGRSSRVAFSPDSAYVLISSPDGYSLFHAENWKLHRRIDRVDAGSATPMAFSHDGRLLAIAPSQVLELFEFPSCRPLASLASPVPENLESLNFSPDASQLIAQTSGGTLHAWDLRRLRAELDALGLDWEMPPLPPATLGAPFTIELDVGEFASAERLTSIMETDPKNAELYFQRGQAFQRLQAFQPALADLDEAIRLDPNNNEAYLQRGIVRSRLKQFVGAVSDFTRTADLKPEFRETFPERGRVYFQLGEWSKAAADFQRAAEGSSDWQHWFDLGRALRQSGQAEEAIQAFSQAATVSSAHDLRARTLAERGKLYEKLGEFALALEDFRRAHELEPEHERYCVNLSWSLSAYPNISPADRRDAIALAERAIQLVPLFPDAWKALGAGRFRSTQWTAALSAFNESNRLRGSADGLTLFLMAMSYWQQGNPELARKHFDEALTKMSQCRRPDELFNLVRKEAASMLRL